MQTFVASNVKEAVRSTIMVIAVIVSIPAFYAICNMLKMLGVDVADLCQLVVIFLFAIMLLATLADLDHIKRFTDSLVSRWDW